MTTKTRTDQPDSKLRAAKFPCWGCGAALLVGANYPAAMALPRTLELWCAACKTISAVYPEGWKEREVMA